MRKHFVFVHTLLLCSLWNTFEICSRKYKFTFSTCVINNCKTFKWNTYTWRIFFQPFWQRQQHFDFLCVSLCTKLLQKVVLKGKDLPSGGKLFLFTLYPIYKGDKYMFGRFTSSASHSIPLDKFIKILNIIIRHQTSGCRMSEAFLL